MKSEQRISGIYSIRNTVNGKVYIGQSIDIKMRWIQHKSRLRSNKSGCTNLQRAWNKYGEESFEFTIIEKCPVDELDDREQFWISKFDSVQSGYNLRYGGSSSRGWKMNESQRLALSNRLKGRKFTDEQRAHMSAGRKQYFKEHLHPNRKQVICLNTGEIFENARFAAEAYGLSNIRGINFVCSGDYSFSGKLNGENLVWMYHSDYLRASEKEINKKMKAKNCRIQESKCFRSVVCINTGEIFHTTVSAARWCNISEQNISGCLRGRQKTAGRHPVTGEPLRWEYAA